MDFAVVFAVGLVELSRAGCICIRVVVCDQMGKEVDAEVGGEWVRVAEGYDEKY